MRIMPITEKPTEASVIIADINTDNGSWGRSVIYSPGRGNQIIQPSFF